MILAMTFWQQFSYIVSRIPDAVTCVVESVIDAVRGNVSPEARQQIAFTAAMIALSAKMAKADGVVTMDEVNMVKRLFVVPDNEQRNVARLFNLAKQDVAGFETYAARIKALYDGDAATLEDILDGLFRIAAADGTVHEAELAFLERVAEIFVLSRETFARLLYRHAQMGPDCPYAVLGLTPDAPPDEVKRAWRKLVSEHHPDKLHSRGLPADFIRLATERVAQFNAAYAAIARQAA
jgi:DnaJ like chaperone protein